MRLPRIAIALALLALAACNPKYEAHKSGGGQRQAGSSQGGNRPPESKKEQLSVVAGPTVRAPRSRPPPGLNLESKPQKRNGALSASANRRPSGSAARIDPVTGLPRKRSVATSDPYGSKPKKKPAGAKKAQRPLPPPTPGPAPPR